MTTSVETEARVRPDRATRLVRTAADVTVSELKLETFLPADAETAERLHTTSAVR